MSAPRSSPGSAVRGLPARTTVVWDALQTLLGGSSGPGDPSGVGDPGQVVLDIGGGTGGFAVRVAGLGHRVTVVDPSPDALAALDRRAHESGVAALVVGQQGDVDGLGDLVEKASVDVVLCHGVLELVDDTEHALAAIAAVLRPGGTLSLLVAQRHAMVVARAMAGHFSQARALLEQSDPGLDRDHDPVPRRFTREEVTAVLDRSGFETRTITGVRVFTDLVPSSLVDLEPGAEQSLVELERAVAARPEYLPLATQLHLLATRRS